LHATRGWISFPQRDEALKSIIIVIIISSIIIIIIIIIIIVIIVAARARSSHHSREVQCRHVFVVAQQRARAAANQVHNIVSFAFASRLRSCMR
jgi:hypothetical protein